MARTHSLTYGLGGNYIILRDTTLLSYYNSLGIDLSTDFGGAVITITDSDDVVYSRDINEGEFGSMRDVNGLKILATEFLPDMGIFTDGRYDISVTVTLDSVDYESISDSIFYGQIYLEVINTIIDAYWKESFADRNVTTDNAIKVKNWMDSLMLAESLGFTDEAERVLVNLQKLY